MTGSYSKNVRSGTKQLFSSKYAILFMAVLVATSIPQIVIHSKAVAINSESEKLVHSVWIAGRLAQQPAPMSSETVNNAKVVLHAISEPKGIFKTSLIRKRRLGSGNLIGRRSAHRRLGQRQIQQKDKEGNEDSQEEDSDGEESDESDDDEDDDAGDDISESSDKAASNGAQGGSQMIPSQTQRASQMIPTQSESAVQSISTQTGRANPQNAEFEDYNYKNGAFIFTMPESRARVQMSTACSEAWLLPATHLQHDARQSGALLAFEFWAVFVGILSLVKHGKSGIFALLVGKFVTCAFSIATTLQIFDFKKLVERQVIVGACSGIDLIPKYWSLACDLGTASAATQGATFLALAGLSFKVVSSWNGKSDLDRHIKAPDRSVRAIGQLLHPILLIVATLFVILVSKDQFKVNSFVFAFHVLWLQEVFKPSVVASLTEEPVRFYRITLCFVVVVILPWLWSGAFIDNRTKITRVVIFCIGCLFFSAVATINFAVAKSATLLDLFRSWPFFQMLGNLTIILSTLLGATCWLCWKKPATPFILSETTPYDIDFKLPEVSYPEEIKAKQRSQPPTAASLFGLSTTPIGKQNWPMHLGKKFRPATLVLVPPSTREPAFSGRSSEFNSDISKNNSRWSESTRPSTGSKSHKSQSTARVPSAAWSSKYVERVAAPRV